METQMIQSSPCPLCGEVAFALEAPSPADSEYAFLWEPEDAPAASHVHPCECTGCGNIQMLVTRC